MDVRIRPAKLEDDKYIQLIAKQSKFTKDFNSIMFVRQGIEARYAAGSIGKAINKRGEIVGFICMNHLKRNPYSTVYYMGVDQTKRLSGVGRALLQWGCDTSPWHTLHLMCEAANENGLAFYRRTKLGQVAEVTLGKKKPRLALVFEGKP